MDANIFLPKGTTGIDVKDSPTLYLDVKSFPTLYLDVNSHRQTKRYHASLKSLYLTKE